MSEREQFLHSFRCKACGNRFGVKRFTADQSKVKIPKCPRRSCGGRAKASYVPDIGFDAAEGKAPSIGGSLVARGFDTAMQMTMEDHGLTNINDTMRPGEVSAPKLAPALQAKADNFWGGQKKQPEKGMLRGKVDMSGLYGAAATGAPATPGVARFTAEQGHAIQPILKSKPTGSSPIPKYVDVGARG